MTTTAPAVVATPGTVVPVPYRVEHTAAETHDTWTLSLSPLGAAVTPRPGQFVMLSAPGVGEVPISTSGGPDPTGRLTHTIRAVGAVTRALCATAPGAVVGVRGPFGTTWPVAAAHGGDLVVVAGGIGLAPLRPAIVEALADRSRFGVVSVLVGARTPGDLLYSEELDGWADAEVLVTVDAAGQDWRGRVGLVTTLIPQASFDAGRATALVCGPEPMMLFTARALLERGVPRERIWLSLERNMHCGVGHCGHCQLGPLLICRDGPVFRLDAVERLVEVREL